MVIPADPDAYRDIIVKTNKPGICIVVGCAGLPYTGLFSSRAFVAVPSFTTAASIFSIHALSLFKKGVTLRQVFFDNNPVAIFYPLIGYEIHFLPVAKVA